MQDPVHRPDADGVVARADADGHTLLLVSSGTVVSAALFGSLPFDTLRDFAPVSRLARFDLVIAVSADSRFKTLAALLASDIERWGTVIAQAKIPRQ